MVRVRFAPSPTGYLHLGNIRTALFNYLFSKKNGGQFILRIEDTDIERSKDEYREALRRDLRWMGILWDEGPEVQGAYGPYLQSQRLPIYQKYIDQLLAERKAYHCYVTAEETEEMKRIARLEKRPPHFDNRGRNFSNEEIESRKARGIKPTVRFKIDKPKLEFHDLIRGDVKFNLDDMVGDFVIQRADGMPTFHMAVCVDDALMQVTHVIRGEDHLSNTPKHILLLEAMGFQAPQYGHLSLIHGPGGEPLSKRLGDVSVQEFRKKGYLPYALANYIALLGWAPGDNRELFSWEELIQTFDLGRVGKSASIYDPHKLDWVNGEHLRLLPDEDFVRLASDYLRTEKQMNVDAPIQKLLPVFKDNISRFDQLEDRLRVLVDDFDYENAALIQSQEGKEIVARALEALPSLNESAPDFYDAFINAIKPHVKARGKNLFMPLRMAITGKEHGPEMKRLFPVLGGNRIAKRLQRALN